jgi:hypothetical protein
MKIGRFEKMRNASNHRNTKQKEVIQFMKKGRGTRSWMYMIAMVVAVMGVSLLLAQVATAASITATVAGNIGGTISPSGTVTVTDGLNKTFVFTPADKYTVGSITVDTSSVYPAFAYTFPKVTGTHTISVTFVPDSDNDGLSNAQELDGITLFDGTFFPGKNSGFPRDQRLDPDSRDLLVILVPAAGGYFSSLQNPLDWLQYITQSLSAGGLPIAVHAIYLPQDQSDRFVSLSSAQKYVRVTEVLDTSNSLLLGQSEGVGTPNGMDNTKIYTNNIRNTVYKITGNYDLANTYVKHTIAHEVGHSIGPLRKDYVANCGGNHYCTSTSTKNPHYILEQSVYSKGTTLYIGTIFTSSGTNNDQSSVKLQ